MIGTLCVIQFVSCNSSYLIIVLFAYSLVYLLVSGYNSKEMSKGEGQDSVLSKINSSLSSCSRMLPRFKFLKKQAKRRKASRYTVANNTTTACTAFRIPEKLLGLVVQSKSKLTQY